MYYFKGRGFLWHETKGPVLWWPVNWVWFALFELKRMRDDRRAERAERRAAKREAAAKLAAQGVAQGNGAGTPPGTGTAGGA
ncbi:hypothetical protein [Rhodoplanes roseus]|uniref:Uncharacterized protein n=1 Tax=Rhodoplanes roseus TaxID=29409 RepID=A0A327KNT9_9BRAD|nr:hypothetical protein [Rhodoplanes roseus]RAI40560.1 hypothetical protein CH341_23495 [Rhodoplanes roseus]